MGTRSKIRGTAAAKWKELIEGQRRSGQSVSAYCHEKGIADSHFYVWRKRLGDKPVLKEFVEISVPAAESGTANAVRIRTPGGYCVEVPPGTGRADVQIILSVLAALR